MVGTTYRDSQFTDTDVARDEPVVGLDMATAARVVGVSKSTLKYWEDTGVYAASFIDPVKHRAQRRLYSFRDLVSLKAIARCRRDLDISLEDIRRAGAYLRRFYSLPWSTLKFGRLNDRLVFWNPVDQRWSDATNGNPTLFDLATLPDEVADDLADVLRRDPATEGQIARHRQVKGNQPTIKGTRIPVATIVRYHDAGYSDDEIIAEYPDLTPDDVAAAIAYHQGAEPGAA